jgi:hypothetical protein
MTPNEIRDLEACASCADERKRGGDSEERQLRSWFAIGNAELCDDCLKVVLKRHSDLLDAAIEHTSKLVQERDRLRKVAEAAVEYLNDPEVPLDMFVSVVRAYERGGP